MFKKNIILLCVFSTFVLITAQDNIDTFDEAIIQDEMQPEVDNQITGEVQVPQTLQAPQQTPQNPTAATQEKDAPLIFPLSIPYLGTFTFEGKIDVANNDFIFTGYPPKNVYNLAVLQLKNPSISFSKLKGLQFNASVSIFNQEINKVFLEKFALNDRILFSFLLTHPLTIPLSPSKKIVVSKVYTELTKKTKSIYALIPFGANPIKVELSMESLINAITGKDTQTTQPKTTQTPAIQQKPSAEKSTVKKLFATITLPQLKLSDLIDDVEGPIANAIALSGNQIRIMNPFGTDATRLINATGILDLSKLASNLPIKLSGLKYSMSKSKELGAQLVAGIEGALNLVPGLLSLTNMQLKIQKKSDTQKTTSTPLETAATGLKKFLTLEGVGNITLPEIGSFNTKLLALSDNGKFDRFEGFLDAAVTFADVVSLKQTKIGYTIGKAIELIGDSNVLGTDVLANIKITQPTDKNAAAGVSFFGAAKDQSPVKPFEGIPGVEDIPGIKDIVLTNVGIGMDRAEGKNNFFLRGMGNILGAQSIVRVIKLKDGVCIKASPSKAIELVSLVPILKQTPLKDLKLPQLNILISTAEFFDPESKMTIPRGISIQGLVDFSQTVSPLFTDILQVPESIINTLFSGVPSPLQALLSIQDTSDTHAITLSIALPTQLKIGSADMKDNSFYISLSKSKKPDPSSPTPIPQIGLKTNVSTILPEETKASDFFGKLALIPPQPGATPTPAQLVIAATMKGMWQNVFDVAGINLSNVSFELGAPLGASIVPSSIGFAGELNLNDKIIALAFKLSANKEFVAVGKYNGTLNTSDLIKIPLNAGMQIPLDALPGLTLENIDVYLVKKATSIGDLQFKKGFTLKGKCGISSFGPINFSGAQGLVEATVDGLSGIDITGTLSKVKLANILEITGIGLDQKEGTADDGPTVKIALTPKEQLLLLSGSIKLFGGIEAKTEVKVTPQQAQFSYHQKLASVFDLDVNAQSIGTGKDCDFKVAGSIAGPQQFGINKEILTTWRDMLKKELADQKNEYLRDLGNLEKKVTNRQNELRKNDEYDALLDTLETTRKALDPAQKAVNSLNNDINRLVREINALSRELSSWSMNEYSQYYNSPYYHKNPDILLAHNEYNDEIINKPLLLAGFLGDVGRGIKKGVNTVTKPIVDTGKKVVNTTKNIGGKILSKGQATAELTAKTTELAAKKAAQLTATGVLQGLKTTLRVTEEAIKNFDPEIVAWRAAQAALTVKFAGIEAGVLAAIGTLTTAMLAAKPLEWLTDISINNITISASLKNMIVHGDLPDITIDISAFKMREKFTFDANPTDVFGLIQKAGFKLFKKFKNVKI
jgi:hypothetical protein